MTNTKTRLNNIEKKIKLMVHQEDNIWICICGEETCVCTEDHKNGTCDKHPSGSCKNCKSTNIFKFMTGLKCMGSPIVEIDQLPELLRRAQSGEINLPIPILGGQSTK